MEDILDYLWKTRHPYDVLFLDIIEGYEIKEYQDYPNGLFYMKNNHIIIEYDKVTNIIWLNTDLIWNVFEFKFSLKYLEISKLMTIMIETHLNLKRTIPIAAGNLRSSTWNHILIYR